MDAHSIPHRDTASYSEKKLLTVLYDSSSNCGRLVSVWNNKLFFDEHKALIFLFIRHRN
jgi:hypothetical protein